MTAATKTAELIEPMTVPGQRRTVVTITVHREVPGWLIALFRPERHAGGPVTELWVPVSNVKGVILTRETNAYGVIVADGARDEAASAPDAGADTREAASEPGGDTDVHPPRADAEAAAVPGPDVQGSVVRGSSRRGKVRRPPDGGAPSR
jgi:hypothetical protein